MPTARSADKKKSVTKKTVAKKATVKKTSTKSPQPPRFKKTKKTEAETVVKNTEVEEQPIIPEASPASSDFLGPRRQVVIEPTSLGSNASSDTLSDLPPAKHPISIADQLSSLEAKQVGNTNSPEVTPVEQAKPEGVNAVMDENLEQITAVPVTPPRRARKALGVLFLLVCLGVGAAIVAYYLLFMIA